VTAPVISRFKDHVPEGVRELQVDNLDNYVLTDEYIEYCFSQIPLGFITLFVERDVVTDQIIQPSGLLTNGGDYIERRNAASFNNPEIARLFGNDDGYPVSQANSCDCFTFYPYTVVKTGKNLKDAVGRETILDDIAAEELGDLLDMDVSALRNARGLDLLHLIDLQVNEIKTTSDHHVSVDDSESWPMKSCCSHVRKRTSDGPGKRVLLDDTYARALHGDSFDSLLRLFGFYRKNRMRSVGISEIMSFLAVMKKYDLFTYGGLLNFINEFSLPVPNNWLRGRFRRYEGTTEISNEDVFVLRRRLGKLLRSLTDFRFACLKHHYYFFPFVRYWEGLDVESLFPSKFVNSLPIDPMGNLNPFCHPVDFCLVLGRGTTMLDNVSKIEKAVSDRSSFYAYASFHHQHNIEVFVLRSIDRMIESKKFRDVSIDDLIVNLGKDGVPKRNMEQNSGLLKQFFVCESLSPHVYVLSDGEDRRNCSSTLGLSGFFKLESLVTHEEWWLPVFNKSTCRESHGKSFLLALFSAQLMRNAMMQRSNLVSNRWEGFWAVFIFSCGSLFFNYCRGAYGSFFSLHAQLSNSVSSMA